MDTMRLKNLTLPQLEDFVTAIDQHKFRAKQIFKWMYQKRLGNFSDMTNMPKTLRGLLSEHACIDKLAPRRILESSHGDAVKFGFELVKSDYIAESVLLIDGDRRTVCVSSQLGCGLDCTFCETGKLGFIRNLTLEEIIGQLVGINDYLFERGDRLATNIVFMGMGEALSNFDTFISALSIIMHEDAFNIGARRITVSTAGVIPSIERLMRENLTIGLAISLNAWNDVLRSEMMPINRKYPIKSLADIAKRYHNKTGRRVTFEYILIRGVTDTDEAVDALYKLLGGFPCKINLIPINPISGVDGIDVPHDQQVDFFAGKLYKYGLAVTIRRSRGQDIMGACGQLTAVAGS